LVKTEFSFTGEKKRARIQLIIADKLKAAVITIAAAPCDHINEAPACAVFGEKFEFDLNFLNEVDADVIDLAVVACRVHIETAFD